MKFTAIDFETANSKRASICAVGLAFVDDRGVAGHLHQLIRPDPLDFDPFNVSIHGISERDVLDAPPFGAFWPQLHASFSGPLVAHNAAFDMSVLRRALDQCHRPYPETDYFCTRVIAKLAWPCQPTYALDHIASTLGLTFQHHNAAEDARACALVAIRAVEQFGVESLHDLQGCCGLRAGRLSAHGCDPCGGPLKSRSGGRASQSLRAADIVPSSTEFGANHPFFGMSIVFTGALSAMVRRAAMQAVVDRGGICQDGVTKDTNILVLGQQGYIGYRAGDKSAKMRKAEELAGKGLPIEILSEREFREML